MNLNSYFMARAQITATETISSYSEQLEKEDLDACQGPRWSINNYFLN